MAGAPDGPGSGVEELPLTTDADVARARHRVRELALTAGLDLVTQTKIVTATSELARNTVIHGRGGRLFAATVHRIDGSIPRIGLRLVFDDDGPGIPDVDRAMTGGWSSGSGLGLGLPGSRRLVQEFDIESTPGAGTRVTVVVWKRDR